MTHRIYPYARIMSQISCHIHVTHLAQFEIQGGQGLGLWATTLEI